MVFHRLAQTTSHQWPLGLKYEVLLLVNASSILVSRPEETLSAHRVGAEHGEANEPRTRSIAPPTHESGARAAVRSRATAAAREAAFATRAGRAAPAIAGRVGVA